SFSTCCNRRLISSTRVRGNANQVYLLDSCTGDVLTNPPCGIQAYTIPFPVIEFLYGMHEPNIAFLNQIHQVHPKSPLLACNMHNQTQVSFNHLSLGVTLFTYSLHLFLVAPIFGFTRETRQAPLLAHTHLCTCNSLSVRPIV